MSVVNGQLANQTTFNNAFMSRTAASTSTVAVVALQNGGSTAIADAQKYIQQLADTSGETENDANRKVYSSMVFVANGDSRKVAIGKLDAQLSNHETRITTLETNNSKDVTLTAVGSSPNANGASIGTLQELTLQPADGSNPGVLTAGSQSIGGQKTFTGNVIVNGDLTILGSTVSAQVTNMEVEDQNITVNKGGNDGTAEEGGVDVERPSGNAGFRFDSTLTSKWKAGLVGSLSEIMTVGTDQTITGQKIYQGRIDWQNVTVGDVTTNSSLTGSAQTLPAPSKRAIRLTNGGLSSIADISGGVNSQEFILINATGASVTVTNSNTGSTSILTGTGSDITLANNASLWLYKDPTSSRWRVIGGSGAGGGGTTNVASGGTGRTSLTQYALLAGDGTNPLTFVGPGAVGTFLKGQGSGANPAFAALTPPTVQSFISGSGTYTLPAGVLYIRVRMVGGGGGGGGSGTSGAGNGSAGNQSTFGSSLLVANGGGGGLAVGGGAGGAGGTASLASPAYGTTFPGGAGGGSSTEVNVNIYLFGGSGGSTPFAGGAPMSSVNANGFAAVPNSGGGGGGAGSSAAPGSSSGTGGGAGGYVEAIIPNPSSTYSYAVGTGGGGGSAGGSGFTGGDGAAGYIEVTEYYQ